MFVIALSAAVTVRYFSVFIMDSLGLTTESFSGLSFTFSLIKWLKAGIGAAALYTILICHKIQIEKTPSPAAALKTNWPMILRLISIMSIFKIINAVMELRLFPVLNNFTIGIAHFYFFSLVPILPVIAFFAGTNIKRFIGWFLSPLIAIFIMLPCLVLFENNLVFVLSMSILVGIFYYTMWAIFTSAIVEYYEPASCRRNGFWFYALASTALLTNVFSYLNPVVTKYLPSGIEFTVLFTGIAAILVLIISFRILTQKTSVQTAPQIAPKTAPEASSQNSMSIKDLFRKHKLTNQETEIASLMVCEGLNSEEIGRRIFRATITVKNHITSIYRKFNVKDRAEFMAMFIKAD